MSSLVFRSDGNDGIRDLRGTLMAYLTARHTSDASEDLREDSAMPLGKSSERSTLTDSHC